MQLDLELTALKLIPNNQITNPTLSRTTVPRTTMHTLITHKHSTEYMGTYKCTDLHVDRSGESHEHEYLRRPPPIHP